MSDFDKEAEREKLREKYERDEEKRETTEQMSELLLKGATMTNAHCGDCGDPIFRYDGQEFCPTCQKPVDRGTGQDADGQDGEDAESGKNGAVSDGNIEVTNPSDDASVRFGGDDTGGRAPASTDEPDGRSAVRSPDEPGDRPTDQPAGTAHTADSDAPSRERDESADVQQVPSADPGATTSHQAGHQAGSPATGARSAETGAGGSAVDHLARAQLLLAETVERYAGLAAEADSPREAREHLETAREAANTFDATEF